MPGTPPEVVGLPDVARWLSPVGDLAVAASQRGIDDVMVVASDEAVADAQRRLAAARRLATEPARAAAPAAARDGRPRHRGVRHAGAVVLCGAAVDPVAGA